jgi:hypothetical protein
MTLADRTDRAAQFITKLLQLTQEKKIEWRPTGSPRDDGRTAFLADVEGKTLRLYRYQKQSEGYEVTDFFGSSPSTRKRNRMVEVTCLEVVDFGLVTYTFEGLSVLSDLYDSAAFSASNVDALIDAILEKT